MAKKAVPLPEIVKNFASDDKYAASERLSTSRSSRLVLMAISPAVHKIMASPGRFKSADAEVPRTHIEGRQIMEGGGSGLWV